MDGQASLTIRSGEGYRVAAMPNNRATVTVRRYETPSGISIIGSVPARELFGEVVFQVTATTPSQSARVINVDVTSGNNNDFIVGTRRQTVTIPATQLVVRFDDDNTNEQDEYITATLRDGTGYTVATTKNSASVLVIDDDKELPVIGFYETLDQPSTVERWIEGTERKFSLFATSMPRKRSLEASEIDVNVKVTEVGGTSNFLASPITKSFTISYDNTGYRYSSKIFRILVPDDNVEEEDGQITVSILPDANYTVFNLW